MFNWSSVFCALFFSFSDVASFSSFSAFFIFLLTLVLSVPSNQQNQIILYLQLDVTISSLILPKCLTIWYFLALLLSTSSIIFSEEWKFNAFSFLSNSSFAFADKFGCRESVSELTSDKTSSRSRIDLTYSSKGSFSISYFLFNSSISSWDFIVGLSCLTLQSVGCRCHCG